MLTFPSNFLWGTATAAHQVEGQNFNNTWWEWEQRPGQIRHGGSSRLACDWWGGRFEEDFDRARDLGTNTHRMSIEWSRIEPVQGVFDQAAISRYRKMLEALHARGIKPMITLVHYALPLWVEKMGGWENPNIVPLLARYAERAVRELKSLCNLWVTLNEPNGNAASGYLLGVTPPGKKSVMAAIGVLAQSVRAHAAMYKSIKNAQPDSQVGIVCNIRPFKPASADSALDKWVTSVLDRLLNKAIILSLYQGRLVFPLELGRAFPEGKDTQDFIGVNYYYLETTKFDLGRPGELFRRPMLKPETMELRKYFENVADIDPLGLEMALAEFSPLHLPIYVCENGIFDTERDIQTAYIVSHLAAVHRAIQAGADVRGYYWWTLVDNFEWNEGWDARFGLYHLDVESQTRTKRPAADIYSRIIRENGVSDDLIRSYGRAF